MKLIQKLSLFVFIISILALIWVNTGSNTETGYTYCNGTGFLPGKSLPIILPGEDFNTNCLGPRVTRSIHGRYYGTNDQNIIIGLVSLLSVISLAITIMATKKSSKRNIIKN